MYVDKYCISDHQVGWEEGMRSKDGRRVGKEKMGGDKVEPWLLHPHSPVSPWPCNNCYSMYIHTHTHSHTHTQTATSGDILCNGC